MTKKKLANWNEIDEIVDAIDENAKKLPEKREKEKRERVDFT